MTRTRKKSKKSKKGKIVKDKDEFVNIYENFDEIPNRRMKGSGVYALYDNYGLYYIGLTNRSLRSRIRRHTIDRHKNKWTKYSWYKIPRIDYVKDIESILLRIMRPRGNKVRGRFRKKRS